MAGGRVNLLLPACSCADSASSIKFAPQIRCQTGVQIIKSRIFDELLDTAKLIQELANEIKTLKESLAQKAEEVKVAESSKGIEETQEESSDPFRVVEFKSGSFTLVRNKYG